MPQWHYFLSAHGEPEPEVQELAERGNAGIYRLPVGAPVALLEGLQRRDPYEWTWSDEMWRAHYLGSDNEFIEISPERAHEIFTLWVEKGIVPGYPPEESPITPELAQYLTGLDEQAQAQWRDVPTPPGAEGLTD